MNLTIAPEDRYTSPYRWLILAVTALTGFFVMGFQTTGLSVLFSEIAESVQLDLIQIGLVWGVGTVMGIVTTLIGGPLIDYFGTRRSLIALCFAVGITSALRAFAFDFGTLFVTSFLFGMVHPVLPMNLIKLNRQWFAPNQLGLASGVMSAGVATGLMLGSTLSATVLSPMLGDWRGVLIFLGLMSIAVGVIWLLVHPAGETTSGKRPNVGLIVGNLRVVMRYRELWVFAIAAFGIVGLMRGVVGYVPTYLREIGWAAIDADNALTVFFLSSLIGVIPISYISDRMENRRVVMIAGTFMMSMGVMLMFFAGSTLWAVFASMVIAGFFFDSFMATKSASITEIDGLDMTMLGSALGFAGMIQNISGTIIPPLGNMLSTVGLNVPFLLWSASGLVAMTTLIVTFKRKRSKFL
jgi:predicted MFS family arabinose efflux permease